MNIIRNSIVRALAALIVGALLIKYPDHTLSGLTIAIGILFLVAGIVSLVTWLYERRREPVFTAYDSGTGQTKVIDSTTVFPVVGLGSLVLGAILALMPETFIRLQMYLVAALLILAALNLYMNLVAARTFGRVGLGYWVLPTVILLAGIVVLVKPMESAALPLIILGWSLLLLGITEFICSFIYLKLKRSQEKVQAALEENAAEAVDEATASEQTIDEADFEPTEQQNTFTAPSPLGAE